MPTMALSGQIRWNFFRGCDLIENGPFYADHAPRLRARWREFDHLAFRERMRRSFLRTFGDTPKGPRNAARPLATI
jgi:hypothetical protein